MCETFKAKVEDLNTSLEKFTNGKRNLDTLLGNQKPNLNKEGLKYKQIVCKSFLKNFFVRRFMRNQPYTTCYYYGKIGHGFDYYVHKKGSYVLYVGGKLVLVSKASSSKVTNQNGPKKIWLQAIKK